MLLHMRQDVIEAGGNPNMDRVCRTCKKAKPRSQFYGNGYGQNGVSCKPCKAIATAICKWRQARKAGTPMNAAGIRLARQYQLMHESLLPDPMKRYCNVCRETKSLAEFHYTDRHLCRSCDNKSRAERKWLKRRRDGKILRNRPGRTRALLEKSKAP